MTRILLLLSGLGFAVLIVLGIGLGAPSGSPVNMAPTPAAPEIYASPIHGGCYIAGPSDCRIHVEPLTIYIASGTKLVYFQLLAQPGGSGSSTVIYDWRPDISNPLPTSGTTVYPSQVAQDFAATCGRSYRVSLQGRDTGDANAYSLGSTGVFTCPLSIP